MFLGGNYTKISLCLLADCSISIKENFPQKVVQVFAQSSKWIFLRLFGCVMPGVFVQREVSVLAASEMQFKTSESQLRWQPNKRAFSWMEALHFSLPK